MPAQRTSIRNIGTLWQRYALVFCLLIQWFASNPSLAMSIASGVLNTCMITETRTIACWGFCLGSSCSPPAAVKFQHVTIGYLHGCAITDAGQIACWGRCRRPNAISGPAQRPLRGRTIELYGCYLRPALDRHDRLLARSDSPILHKRAPHTNRCRP